MSAAQTPPKHEPSPWSPEFVRDISEAVYRKQLGPQQTASMIASDKDSGEKLRRRAGAYDALTRSYLEVAREINQKGKL